jgi:S1-C subfamily serine protease
MKIQMGRQMVLAVLVLVGMAIAAPVQAQQASAERGWLGISFQLEEDRPVVREVLPGSPAAEAGLRRGDVIVRLNGRALTGDVWTRARWEPGDRVRLGVQRDGREQEVTVRAGERPQGLAAVRSGGEPMVIHGDSILRLVRVQLDSVRAHLDTLRLPSLHLEHDDSTVVIALQRARAAGEDARRQAVRARGDAEAARRAISVMRPAMARRGVAGAELSEVNPGLAEHLPADRGLLVLDVSPGTPAARAGLRAGDVITAAGGTAVADVEALRAAVDGAEANRIVLEVVRRDGRRNLTMSWDGPGTR